MKFLIVSIAIASVVLVAIIAVVLSLALTRKSKGSNFSWIPPPPDSEVDSEGSDFSPPPLRGPYVMTMTPTSDITTSSLPISNMTDSTKVYYDIENATTGESIVPAKSLVPEIGDIGDSEAYGLGVPFARVKGQSQPPLPSELRDWTQKNNHLPMSGIFDDGVASCVSPNQKRREQLAVPPPANYTDYYEGQCLWNEIDNAVRIDGRQLGGRIMKSVSDWRLFPTTYGDFTEAPSLFLSRSCTTYKSNYDCDPTKASFLSAEDCQNAHPYCETADITYWGRLTLDGTAYLNSAAYSDASWLQVRLATPKVLKERSLDATNVLVKDATPVFPVLRSFVVERPIFGQSTSRTIDISTTAKVLFVSDLTGKAQLLRQEDGAGWTAAQNASIPNVRLLEEVNF